MCALALGSQCRSLWEGEEGAKEGWRSGGGPPVSTAGTGALGAAWVRPSPGQPARSGIISSLGARGARALEHWCFLDQPLARQVVPPPPSRHTFLLSVQETPRLPAQARLLPRPFVPFHLGARPSPALVPSQSWEAAPGTRRLTESAHLQHPSVPGARVCQAWLWQRVGSKLSFPRTLAGGS